MNFEAVSDVVDGHPHMKKKRGREVYDHVVKHECRDILELGTYHGVSTCYLAAAVEELGSGRVTTMDRSEAGRLEPNVYSLLEACGLTPLVDVVLAERSFTWELKKVLELPERPQFDFVFLDAWKRDYQKFFDMVFPRMPKGGLFVAHNVLNKKSEMPDFLNTIETRPDLFSTIVAPSGEGVSVSWKRK